MLDILYTETIEIEKTLSDDGYNEPSITSKEINGAIQDKVKYTNDANGKQLTTNKVLNTNEDLDIAEIKIVYNGRSRELREKTKVFNHLSGSIDHYEYLF